MIRRLLLVLLVTMTTVSSVPESAAAAGCGTVPGTCGVTADEANGVFHGLIAVTDQGWVLDMAARDGTEAGCGDCVWIVILACPQNTPADPGGQTACTDASGSPVCKPGQLLYRLYLTTRAETDTLEGTICLGGTSEVVAVGDAAAADVERYLRDVTPPALRIASRPQPLTLAGLTTYFTASPPSLRPMPFGGPTVTETITITPTEADWLWGDGDDSGWLAATGSAAHRYLRGGRRAGALTVRWTARYTISYAGRTFGPYDADHTLTKQQPFVKRVATSQPVLVRGD
jgi:hypothetical protein